MKIAVVGGELTPKNYQLLDKKLNELIEEKNLFLFTMLCGVPSADTQPRPTLGSFWAKRNGAPIQWMHRPTPAHLIKEADYIIFFIDGNQEIKNMMMKYKMTGKHGSVINV